MTLKLTVPYVRITGASNVIAGIGVTTTGTPATIRTDSGLGDIVSAATYNFYNSAATQIGADVTGKIKFGTADKDKGLGTGKNDYSVLLEVYKKMDRWTLLGGVGYAVLGSSADIPLNNVFNLTAASMYKISDMSNAGLSYDYRERSSSTNFAQSELTAFYVRKFDKAWKAQVYLLKGFSDGSPDWGGGATLNYSF